MLDMGGGTFRIKVDARYRDARQSRTSHLGGGIYLGGD